MPKLLICDDQPATIAPLLEYLTGRGFDVRVCPSGQDVLRKALSGRPDLILLEVGLPGLDGFATCRRLKAHPATAEIPVLFLSGQGGSEDRLQGFAAGAEDYIAKPCAAAEVLARVEVHLRARRRFEQMRAMAHAPAADPAALDDPAEGLFQRAIGMLRERPTDPPSLVELARAVGTNDRKLTKLFRQRLGMSVFEYLCEHRLEVARQLLGQPALQIRLIADRSGYRNPGDFTRAFRRRYGLTPREYRRSLSLPADQSR